MARPQGKFVAEIGAELALPLARAHCQRWRLRFDPEAGEGMFWAGAFVDDGLRALLGLASLGERGLLVTGIFTDGSPQSLEGTKMLVQRLAEIPCDLWGTLHLPTERSRRMFRKDGWSLSQGVIG